MRLLTIWGHRKELYTVQPPELLEAVVDNGYREERLTIERKLEEYRKYDDFSSVAVVELELGEGSEDSIMSLLYPEPETVQAYVRH